MPVWDDNVTCHCSTGSTGVGYIISDYYLIFVALFTVTANGLFVFTIAMNKRLQTSTNKFMLSNAVIDLLVGMFVMPFHIMKNIMGTCWPYGFWLCRVCQSIDIHLTTISIYHLTGVAVERFTRIVFPFWYERWVKKIMPWLIVALWTLPVAMTFAPLMGDYHQEFPRTINNNSYSACGIAQNRPCKCSFWGTARFTMGTTIFQFIIPIIITVILYSKIFTVAYKLAKETQAQRVSVAANLNLSGASDSNLQSRHNSQQPLRRVSHFLIMNKDVRVVRVCAVVLLLFVLCWGPYFIMMTLEAYCVGPFYFSDQRILHPTDVEKETGKTTAAAFFGVIWVGLLNSALSPVVLFAMEKNYRNGLRLAITRNLPRLARLLDIDDPFYRSQTRNGRSPSVAPTGRPRFFSQNSEDSGF